MKHLILIIIFIATIHTANAGWFGNTAEIKRREQAEQKLEEQQAISGKWQQTAFTLGIGCVVSLIAGTAIGSKGRKSAKPSA